MSSQPYSITLPPEAVLEAAPVTPAIELRANAGTLAWDGSSLLVADDYSGAILRVDGTQQRRIATLPAGGVIATTRFGGIAATPYGTLFVSRIGHGQSGAVFRVERDGHTEALDKLPPRFWRGGLAYDVRSHSLYATQYMRSRSGAFDGSIVEIDLVTGEPLVIDDGFLHPLGLVRLDRSLVVTDARQRAVFRVDVLATGLARRVLIASDLDQPEAVCACGEDSVLVTTYDAATGRGSVRRIWLDGDSYLVARGAWEPRGIATDGDHAFVSVRRGGRVLVLPL
ncbi:MAG TPA: hypothetical protein VFQ53_02860 [Kofleriaceae bacterium]|nr:hypothetical protein [Kofleriaceae bacterium]